MKKFWNVINLDNDTTELTIYDTIAMKTSVDWWTDEKGTEVTPVDFRNDIQEISTKNICIRVNSGGGDVFAAEAISNIIKDERKKGKCITCKIDGICASAAVQIAMSCEKVSMPASAYMMIHDPLTLLMGYYQTKDLSKISETLDKIKDGIVNAYVEKTGIDKAEIENMMSEETWLTGDEAVEKGLADELLTTDVNVVDNISKLSMKNDLGSQFAAYTKVPESVKSVFNANCIKNKEVKGEDVMEFKNSEELQKAFPDFCNEIINNAKTEGAEAERERIKAIDEIADKVDKELVNQAKYVTLENAENVAFNAMKEGKFVNTQVINGLEKDAGEANGVEGGANLGTSEEHDEKAEAKNIIEKVANDIFKKGENK